MRFTPWLDSVRSRARSTSMRSLKRRRSKVNRQALIEFLETRQMLTAPNFVSVSPNVGEFLQDGGTLNTVPREFVFQFSPGQTIQSSTVGALRVVGAGHDGSFTAAGAITDFGSNGAIVMRLAAKRLGAGDNGNTLSINYVDNAGNGPQLSTSPTGNLTLLLDTDAANASTNATTAGGLITFLNTNPNARELLTATVLTGSLSQSLVPAMPVNSVLPLTGSGAASAVNTFGVPGLNIQFEANTPGENGNRIEIQVNRLDLGSASSSPRVTVIGQRIEVTLNENSTAPTTAEGLANAINTNSQAALLVNTRIVTGNRLASLAAITDGTLIRLAGADRPLAASTTSGFQTTLPAIGSGDPLLLQFEAKQQGIDGNEISILFNRANLSATNPAPTVSVNTTTKRITVTLNNNVGAPTKASDLLTALASSTLVTAKLVSGLPTTSLTTLATGTVMQLGGADAASNPGYRDLLPSQAPETPRKVVYRFAAPLTDDLYRIEIIGTGAAPVTNTAGEAVDNGSDTFLDVKIDLGATVSGVVPQPMIRQQLLTVNSVANLSDGDTISISSGSGSTLQTFEINDTSGTVTAPRTGNIAVNINKLTATTTDVALAIANAINAATFSSPDVTATASGGSLTVTGGAFDARVKLSLRDTTSLTQREGSLVQRRNLVNVYLNNDALNESLAQDPKFYQLIDTKGTLVTTDDEQLIPTAVIYDPVNHTSTLNFGADLPLATYKLTIGDSEESNDTRTTAVSVGTVFTTTPYQHVGFVGDGNGSTDFDLYRITLTAGGTIDAILNPSATLNSAIRLFDDTGMVIDFDNGGTNAGDQDNLSFTSLIGGTFYVGVSNSVNTSYSADGGGTTSGGTTGSYRLQISTTTAFNTSDDNSSFTTATGLGVLGTGGQIFSSTITPQSIALPPPAGGSDEPGHREIPHESHGAGSGTIPSTPSGLGVVTFFFPNAYGVDSQGNTLFNQITDDQKTRAREIFEMYGAKFGFEVRESTTGGLAIVTGDPRAVDPNIPPDAVGGIAGGGIALMNARLNFTAQDNQFGGSWMGIALHEIGHAIGLGHSYDIRSDQGNGVSGEDQFNGNNDTVHGNRISPNTGTDIDIYEFVVDSAGTFSGEIVAERQATSSLLNSALKLYRKAHAHVETDFIPAGLNGARIQFRTRLSGVAGNGTTVSLLGADLGDGVLPSLTADADGIVVVTLNTRSGSTTTAQQLVDLLNLNSTQVSARILSGDTTTSLATFAGTTTTLLGGAAPVQIAQNDDYFSNDSFIGLTLDPDTYYIAVSSTGNVDYDPTISDTGFNGTTEGAYSLRLSLETSASSTLEDTTQQRFDGDSDGNIGGTAYEFAFQSANTLVVDKTVIANSTTTLNTTTTTVRVNSLIPFPTTPGFQIKIDSEELTVTAIDTVNKAFTVQRGRNGTSAASHALNAPVSRVIATTAAGAVSAGATQITVASASRFISQTPFVVTIGNDRVRVTAVDTMTNMLTVDPTPNGYADGSVIRELGGTLQNPFGLIKSAITAAVSGDTIRVVGNGGTDNDAQTFADARPYTIGFADSGAQLEDGAKLELPKNVVLQIDSGAVVKLQAANLDAGTSAVGLDRSGSAIQVLGTPRREVFFASFENDLIGGDSDGVTDGANAGDWGGLVFREDSDFRPNTTGSTIFDAGIFLNYVAHANISHGGGVVSVNSVAKTFNSIHLVTARPTIAFNTITNGSDAAISADPDSFDDSRGRIGPDIHNNIIYDNTTNGVFVRIETLLGQPVQRLTKTARFDDTDITHVITQNLEIVGNPGGPLDGAPRPSGRLAVDPGVVVKLGAARIEGLRGNSALIAEGTAVNPVIFTSIQDDRFGSGGTYDVTGNLSQTAPSAGNWGGLAFNANSRLSIDQAYIAYGGGSTPIEGSTDSFNTIEIHHAGKARIANTTFDTNAGGSGGSRNGRGGTSASTIFVRQAQPIIVNNVFINNAGSVVDINANAMRSEFQRDTGRSTGEIAAFDQFSGNHGPLVRLNRVSNNSINGMNVRADVLTTESVWDDTDIVHVLTGEILVDQHHTYSGIRLQSNPGESLVVKLSGPNAGFTADGIYLDIDDRIGGTVQVIGQPGFPVVLTSLTDDSVGASFDAGGFPHTDTNNNGASVGTAGAWRSLKFTQKSNTRNVKTIVEAEHPNNGGIERNDNTFNRAEFLGELAPQHITGPTPANYNADDTGFRSDTDDNRPAGFEVHGFISGDDAGDVDIYSFKATALNEVWIDLDRTRGNSLDPVVEVILADGTLVARARYNDATGVVDLTGSAQPLEKDAYNGGDFYTFNYHDTGFRLTLPGDPGSVGTYFVRVRSNQANAADLDDDNLIKNGLTRGEYQLQIRERQKDEKPGSVVRYADIRFATNGIDVSGIPSRSPLVGENTETTAANGPTNTPQNLGNLLDSDRNVISFGGDISSSDDADFFRYNSDYASTILGDSIQVIGGASGGGKTWTTTFDLDYADGLSRADTTLVIFDSTGRPILVGRESNIEDDRPAAGNANDLDDLSRGSIGALDPFIGPVQMPTGNPGSTTNYDLEVLSNRFLNTQLSQTYNATVSNPLVRLEPINSTSRIIEDHIGFQGYTSNGVAVDPTDDLGLFDVSDATALSTHVRPFDLGDTVLFVNTPDSLQTVNPFFGQRVTVVDNDLAPGNTSDTFQDIVMRSDGTLYGYRRVSTPGGTPTPLNDTAGQLDIIDTGTGAVTLVGTDRIRGGTTTTTNITVNQITHTDEVDALTYRRNAFGDYHLYYSVRENSGANKNSKLYRANPDTGDARFVNGQPLGFIGDMQPSTVSSASVTTGINGATVAFDAVAQGVGGNGIQVNFTAFDRTGGNDGQITVGVAGSVISVTLDTNPKPSVGAVVSAINNNAQARAIVTTTVTNGAAGNDIGGLVSASVTLSGGAGTPLRGNVTGLAFAEPVGSTTPGFRGNNLYGVTDDGEFVGINLSNGDTTLIRDFKTDLAISGFQGLAIGPQNVSDGAFNNTLFAITSTGRLIAFDTNGVGVTAFDTSVNAQRIRVPAASPSPTDGTFTLTFDDGVQTRTTDPIAWNAPGVISRNEFQDLDTTAYGGSFTLTYVANDGEVSSLLGSITSGVTLIDVDDAAAFPPSNFVIRVDAEEMLVTSRSGNRLTIGQRGYNGTTASVHNSDATVFEVLTTRLSGALAAATSTPLNDGLDALLADNVFVVNDASVFPATPFTIRVDDEQMTVTNVNIGTNTLTVTRAVNGSTIATHGFGDIVELISGSLTVVDTVPLPVLTPYQIRIDNEDFTVTNAVGSTLTVLRGANGTAISSHMNDATAFQVQTTTPLTFNASSAEILSALDGLTSLTGNVAVTGGTLTNAEGVVEFINGLAATDVPLLNANSRQLVGDEIQSITLDTRFTGTGTYTITFGGQTTNPINVNANAATIESELEALSSIRAGNVTVSGGTLPGNPFTLTFIGALEDTNVATVSVDSTLLVNNERQQLVVTGGPTGGAFQLQVGPGGPITGLINYSATALTFAANIEAGLEALASINDVTVTNPSANIFEIQFTGLDADINFGQLILSTNALTGGTTPSLTLTTLEDGNNSVVAGTTQDGFTTGLVFNTTPAAQNGIKSIQDQLENLLSISPGDVSIVGGDLPGTPVDVTFQGAYAGVTLPIMVINTTQLITPGDLEVANIVITPDGIADSFSTNIGSLTGVTGLAFSPLDFNLWHPTTTRGANAGHGINAAYDNSRTPSAESRTVTDGLGNGRTQSEQAGGTSFYFGLDEYVTGSNTPYLNYEASNTQLGILDNEFHRDLTASGTIGANYNLPGGAIGSLITDQFDLTSSEGGESNKDRPTLYFNYFLATEGSATAQADGGMRDSARVFISSDDGQSWDLLATNNTPKGDDSELPNFITHSRLANTGDPRQRVQELFDNTGSWRQARVDLGDFVGLTGLRLRFDFSTAGTLVTTGVTTNDTGLPAGEFSLDTPVDDYGNLTSSGRGQNNNHEGFYVDDIVVGWSERGEMITGAVADKSNFQVPQAPMSLMLPQELLSGTYQVEIRRGFEYAANKDKMTPDITVNNTFDTNVRFIPGSTLGLPDVSDNFELGDMDETTFGFDPAVGWNPSTAGANAPWFVAPTAISPTTTLTNAAGISAAATTMTVASTAGFPVLTPFVLVIDLEPVGAFYAGVGSTINIVRGPTATAHANGATVSRASAAAQSSPITNSQIAAMQVTQTASAVTFRYKVLSDVGDSFRVFIDELGGESGAAFQSTTTIGDPLADADGYKTATVTFDPGVHTIFFAYQKDGTDGVDAIANALEGVTIDDVVFQGLGAAFIRGDRNVEREQGHFQIENNFIRNSLVAGINVTAGTRDPITNASPLGAPIKFNTQNSEQLAPGITVSNNVIAGFGQFGVRFQGDATVGGTGVNPATMVPFGKIINNTIYGGSTATGTGIRVEVNASPTLLNNLIANTQTGVFVDATSSTTAPSVDRRTVLSRTFFHGNTTNINGAVTDASMIVDPAINPLFVNPTIGNFYLASGSQAIDRSLSIQADRSNFVSLKAQAGIPNSDAVSPGTDVFGQTRVDDPSQAPSGIGGEVFNDIGAIERADDDGGVASLTVPEDNGPSDLDPLPTVVHVDAPLFFNQFVVKLTDSGIGIDDSTVTFSQFTLTQTTRAGTRTLVNNTDYVFAYNSNTNEAIITSVTLFPQDARFTLTVDNSTGTGIKDFAGNALIPNQLDGTVRFDVLVTNGPNDAPVNTVPVGPTIDENTALSPTFATFSAVDGNAISVDDPDAFINDNTVQVTLTASNGTVTLPQNYANFVTLNTATATGSVVTFTGTIDNINTMLAGGVAAVDKLIFTPTQDYNSTLSGTLGAAKIEVRTNDLGNFSKLPLVPKEDVDNIIITVRAVNSAPTATSPMAVTTAEDTNYTFTGSVISISDLLDDLTGTSTAQVRLEVTHGVLSLGDTSGLTFSVGDGTGDQILQAIGTIAAINSALNNLVYDPDMDYNGSDTLTVTVNDLGNVDASVLMPSASSPKALTGTSTTAINITAVNDAPINLFNAASDFPPVVLNALERTDFVFDAMNPDAGVISVSDIDAGESTGVLKVTLTATNGTLSLNATAIPAMSAFVQGDGVSDAVIEFRGTVAEINAALDGLVFIPDPLFTTTTPMGPFATVTISTDDEGRTGGGSLTDTDVIQLNVRELNDTPIVTVPAAQMVDEDATLTLSAANSNQIMVSDADAGTQVVRITVSATNGVITFADTSSLTLFAGANGTSSVAFEGTIADIQASLDAGVDYDPAADYFGMAAITVSLDDLGNTGSGGPRTGTGTLSVTVSGVDDAPLNNVPLVTQIAIEDTPLIFSASNGNQIFISDVDDPTEVGTYTVTLALTNAGFTPGTLTLSSTAGLMFVSGANGASTMQFIGTLSDINAALDGLEYLGAPGQDTGVETLTITTDDPNVSIDPLLTDTDSILISLDGNNDPPENSVPSSQQILEDSILVFSSSNNNAISVSDIDAANGDLQVTLTVTEGRLIVNQSAIGDLTSITGDNSSTVQFVGRLSEIQAVLDGLQFIPAPDDLDNVTLTITTNDQGNTGAPPLNPLSDTDTVTITISPSNDAPAVGAQQSPLAAVEDGVLVISGANNNRVSVSDVDLGSSQLRVILSVTHGTLTLSRTTGLTFQGGANGSSTMTFVGTTPTAINAALDGMSYRPTAGFNGNASLTITINDQGGSGAGGPQQASTVIPIAVSAVNDAPTLMAPTAAQLLTEDGIKVFSSVNGNSIVASDVDVNEGSGQVSVQLTVTNGTLTLGSESNVVITAGANITREMTITGAIGDVNLALNGLTYRPVQNYNGSDSLQVVLNDLNNNGTGGAKTATASVSLTVSSVNDAPVNVVPSVSPTTSEDVSRSLTGITVSDVDAGNAVIRVTLGATNGTLSIGTLGSTSIVAGGNNTPTLTLSGTIVALNAALNTLSYNPTLNFNGTAVITVTSSDQGNSGAGSVQTDTDSFNVSVAAVNDLPVGVADVYAVLRNGMLVTSDVDGTSTPAVGGDNGVLANDIDVDSPRAGWIATLVSAPQHHDGSFTLNSNGTFQYVHNGEPVTSDSFTYQISDGTTGSPVDVTVTININDPPVIVGAGDATLNENAANGTVVVDLGSTDANGDTVSFSIIDGNTNGAFAINPVSGIITVVNSAALNFEVTPVFALTVQATDSAAVPGTSTALVNVRLSDVAEAVSIGAATWTDAGLTLRVVPSSGGDLLRVVTTGTDTSVFEEHVISKITSLMLNGRTNAADALTVDFSNGSPIPASGLSYNGGSGTGSDSLRLINGIGFSTITHNFASGSSGNVTLVTGMAMSVVNYTGLEPIFDDLGATNRVFSFSAANDAVVLSDRDGISGNNISSISTTSLTAESVDFRVPSDSLTISLVDGNDTLTGTMVDEAFGGAISILGGNGNDQILLSGLENAVFVDGQAGIDNIVGGLGNDVLVGGEGNDVIDGGEGNDTLFGAAGSDTLTGGAGINSLNGQGTSTDTVLERVAGIVVVTNSSITSSVGTSNLATTELLQLIGSSGDDSINLSAWTVGSTAVGATLVDAGDGNDTITGSLGRDSINGQGGNDVVYGGEASDVLTGGLGADFLSGDGGDDALLGDDGDDQLFGGSGNDTLTGAAGVDILLGNGGGGDQITETIAGSAILTSNSTFTTGSLVVNGVTDIVRGIEKTLFLGSSGADRFDTRNYFGTNVVSAGAGNDTILGGVGFDQIFAGTGDDAISTGAASDIVFGEDGNDTINGGDGNDFLNGNLGNDVITGAGGDDKLFGELGNDTILGGIGNDSLAGREGDDVLLGESGIDTVRGESGRDTLAGGGNGNAKVSGDILISESLDLIDEAFAFAFPVIV